MLTRLAQCPEDAEKRAAYQVMMLAEGLQDLLYYCADADHTLPAATTKELNRTYRTLKNYTVYFRGTEHSLAYEPPTGRFAKGSK